MNQDLVSQINYSQDNLVVLHHFDELKRIKDILYRNNASVPTQDLYLDTLTYDFKGNITKSVDALRIGNFLFESKPQTVSPNFTYDYNCDNYLIDWKVQFITTDLRPNSPDPIVYNYQWNYDYDALGNRKSFLDVMQNNNDLSYTYSSSHPNRLTNIYGPLNSNTLYILGYNNNGGLDTRKSCVSRNGNSHLTHQKFSYDYRGLLTKFEFGEMDVPDNTFNVNCTFANMADFYNQNEWQYRMNPSGEREQKRMYRKFMSAPYFALPWEYYQLGANNEQLVVYHGINLNTDQYLTAPNQSVNNPLPSTHQEYPCQEGSFESKSALFIYPVEFNISAPGLSKMRLVLDESGNWKKEFLVKDQVGTTKALVESKMNFETNLMEPFVTNRYIYGPYGEPLHYDNEKERQGFIGKERDLESGLADHGVRKYDYISGRFTSVDPLSEKYIGFTPYQYSANNPVYFLDNDGNQIIGIMDLIPLLENTSILRIPIELSVPKPVFVPNLPPIPIVLNPDATFNPTTTKPIAQDNTSVSKPMEMSNPNRDFDKFQESNDNKNTSNKEPKMDGGNNEIWKRFVDDLKKSYGKNGADKIIKNNDNLKRGLHDFQKLWKSKNGNVPKEEIPKVIKEYRTNIGL